VATSDTPIEAVRQQLLSDLQRLTRQIQSRLRYQAVLYWLMATSAVIAGLLMIDCLFQREEVGLRWLSWIILFTSSIYAAYRWLRPMWHLRVQPLDVAQWIENRQPEWSGRISTALELAEIEHTDDRFGSQSFRNAVLAQWQTEPSKPKWDELINNDNLKRASTLLALIASSVFLLVAVWPEVGIHALKRLFVPWSNEQWPRADQLELVNLPAAVGLDSIIQLEVRDRRPPLPEDVTIELRYPDSAESVVSIPTQQVADLAVASLPPILQEIQVRAVGGDDRQMPWQQIRVVEVPGWKQYKFQIQPPQYIRQSASALQRLTTAAVSRDGIYEITGQRIQVLAGSHLQFVGELTWPIQAISIQPLLVATSDGSTERKSGQQTVTDVPWQLQLGSDQISVKSVANQQNSSPEKTSDDAPAGFALMNQSLAWAVRMETLEKLSLESPNHWKIEVLLDNAPEVVLDSPQLKSLTLGAPLPLRAVARDDWGLKSILAKLTISSAPEVEYELPIEVAPSATREQFITQAWDFTSQLASAGVELKLQDQISIWLEAIDLSGKTNKSNVERLSLESKQRQLENIASRQNSIMEQLAELLSAQESAQDLAQRTVRDWKQQAPTQQHLDALNSVSQLQQTIRQKLFDSPRSLQTEIDRLLQLISENRLDETQYAEQLKQLRKSVAEIGNDSATAAFKSAGSLQAELAKAVELGDKSKLSSLASELDLHQTQAKDQLRELVNQLDERDSKNRLREKILEIARQQEQLNVDTNQLNVESLRKEPPDFPERLAVSAAAQAEISTMTEEWLSEVLQLKESESLAAVQQLVQQLQEAARVLVDAQVVESMRSSSTNLKSEQLGRAVQSQKQIQTSLQEALSKLEQAGSSELLDSLATQEQRLRDLRDKAQLLAQQQLQLAKELSNPQASANAQALADDQERIGQATSQLIDEMSSEEQIRETLRQAQQLQQQAAQAAANKSLAQAADLAAQAAKKLDEVAAQLDQQADQANQQVMQQQMYELASTLERMVMDQQAIMPRYEQLAVQSAELTADFVAQSRSLVQKQSAVRESLRKLLPSTEQLQVFHWVLQQAESDLTRAIAAAERNRLKPDAINAAEAGLRKLVLANESLMSSQDEPAASETDPNQEQPQNDDQQSKSDVSMPPLASLKLIRSLQLELKEQTAALENDSNRRSRILELTRQQQELAELLERLVAESQTQQEQGR
jgi:hypothetical protein